MSGRAESATKNYRQLQRHSTVMIQCITCITWFGAFFIFFSPIQERMPLNNVPFIHVWRWHEVLVNCAFDIFQSPFNQVRYELMGDMLGQEYFLINSNTGQVFQRRSIMYEPSDSKEYNVSLCQDLLISETTWIFRCSTQIQHAIHSHHSSCSWENHGLLTGNDPLEPDYPLHQLHVHNIHMGWEGYMIWAVGEWT